MKIEDLLFAMCDDNNDYLEEANSPIKCGSHESDEGCCIINTNTVFLSPQAAVDSTLSTGHGGGGGETIRRVKSTPNLLQIPSPHRHRKRSDDSAVGSSTEETESYRSNDSLPTGGGDPSPSKKIYTSYRHSCPHDSQSSASSASSTASSSFKNSSCIAAHNNLRTHAPNLPLYVTEASTPTLSSLGTSDKYRRSVSANAYSGSGDMNVAIPKRLSLSTSSSTSSFQLSSGVLSTANIYTTVSSSSSSVTTSASSPLSPSSLAVNNPIAHNLGVILSSEGKLLRPPSVVISDHDLCQEEGETFITLEELDAEFSEQQQQRRRFSDCSTCSSLSFSESDLTALSNEDDSEETAVNRVSKIGIELRSF